MGTDPDQARTVPIIAIGDFRLFPENGRQYHDAQTQLSIANGHLLGQILSTRSERSHDTQWNTHC